MSFSLIFLSRFQAEILRLYCRSLIVVNFIIPVKKMQHLRCSKAVLHCHNTYYLFERSILINIEPCKRCPLCFPCSTVNSAFGILVCRSINYTAIETHENDGKAFAGARKLIQRARRICGSPNKRASLQLANYFKASGWAFYPEVLGVLAQTVTHKSTTIFRIYQDRR
jgi:hypothetical protein